MELQSRLDEVKKLNGQIVALSADNLETALETKRALGLGFTVLPDPGKEVIQQYGVLHPQEGIARPAVYLIDKKGIIRYRYIGKDAADRPKTAQLINALRWL